MKEATLVAIDLAKNIFWIHGVNAHGRKVFSKEVNRAKLVELVAQLPACVIAMEACSSAHHWARKFMSMGHEVRLIAPQFVKPFVKSNKNDANDAEAIAEAASRPSMRFVAVKSVAQQDILMRHRVRERMIASRTAMVNELRGILSEYGVIVPQGRAKLMKLLPELLELDREEISAQTRSLIEIMREELIEIGARISKMDEEIAAIAEGDERCRRLKEVPGVGPLTASAIVAAVGNAHGFKNGRELSAYLGLVPRQHSSGGKQNLGGISKRGDKYLRKLLVHGARAALYRIESREDVQAQWLKRLVERRGFNKAVVALANKNARAMLVMLKTGASYKIPA